MVTVETTRNALIELAKMHNQTMHEWILNHRDTIFEVVYESGVIIVYNELPSGYIKYSLLTH